MKNSFSIFPDQEGTRLDVFLSESLSVTRTKVKELIEDGHVRIAGKTPKPSLKVNRLMHIEGEIPEEKPLTLLPENIPLEILYQDRYFLGINKPAHMVVHPSFGHATGTLVNAVLSYLEGHGEMHGGNVRPGIVHRLDKGTTGVILVARDMKTQEMLSHLFKERNVTKTYRAIVEGDVKKDQWTIEGNIGRHPTERKKMAVLAHGGREAMTSFRVLMRLGGFTYLEAYPKTGRTHQIRVHLAYAGYPIVGDDTYGRKAKALVPRPLLHAYKIELMHPVENRFITIEAPVPADMEEFIRGRTDWPGVR